MKFTRIKFSKLKYCDAMHVSHRDSFSLPGYEEALISMIRRLSLIFMSTKYSLRNWLFHEKLILNIGMSASAKVWRKWDPQKNIRNCSSEGFNLEKGLQSPENDKIIQFNLKMSNLLRSFNRKSQSLPIACHYPQEIVSLLYYFYIIILIMSK